MVDITKKLIINIFSIGSIIFIILNLIFYDYLGEYTALITYTSCVLLVIVAVIQIGGFFKSYQTMISEISNESVSKEDKKILNNLEEVPLNSTEEKKDEIC